MRFLSYFSNDNAPELLLLTITAPRSKSFGGQGHVSIYQWESLVQRGVVSKYEVNQFGNKEVIANVMRPK